MGVISRKFAYKFVKSKYSEKFQINQNLQTILFKMMHNIFILRHLFSTERWGGGRPEPPRSLILLKCVFSGERSITSPNFMVPGFQMGKLQRGGGGTESPPLAVLDSKKPGMFRTKLSYLSQIDN